MSPFLVIFGIFFYFKEYTHFDKIIESQSKSTDILYGPSISETAFTIKINY